MSLLKAVLKVIAAISGFMGQPLIAKLFPYIGEVSVSDYWQVIDERNRYRAAFMAAMEAKQKVERSLPPFICLSEELRGVGESIFVTLSQSF
ncbi:MAG: hypothetical protein F6K32_16615 [Desertifilum sp. SIO1I2]|nr:hypothetical protein [Desertifilum sp. SIO1I2]